MRALQRSIGNAAVVRLLGARSAGSAAVGADRAPAPAPAPTPAPAPVQRSTVPGVVGSPGRALNASLRREMEARFGADFGDVRVHDDAAAARSAAEVGAGAYTSGRHVVIGDGGHDKHTLAHELTHVLQQRRGPVAGRQNGAGLKVSDPSDRFEREAEANAHRVMRGGQGAAPDDAETATRERAAGAPAAQPIVQRSTALLDNKDPARNDTTQLRDWPTLVAAVEGGQPTAVDVHQVLLTYKYLSDGWKSGMMEVGQAAANSFGAAKNIPDTVVTFGQVTRLGGYTMGTSMTADPLTLRGAAGSDATRGGFAGLAGSVEGHLLNAYLHGPATSENLAPFTKNMNSVHSTVVEEPLKKMVYNERRVFRYAVTVKHNTDPTDPLPRSIRCQVTELRANGSTVKPRGFVQDVKIDQNGGVTTRSRSGVATGGQLAFDAGGDAARGDIATVWNSLLKPWSHAYGTLVAKVLETAYDAVRVYEVSQGRIFGLPETELESEKGAFRNARGRDVAMAVEMTAFPLTMRPPRGGSPGYEPEGLAWGEGLVRGHLLNHHLHGPADKSNLAPMTNNLNQEFERQVENPVKRMVLTEGKVLYFHITMEGEADHGSYEGIPERLRAVVHECRLIRNANDRQLASNWRKGPELINMRLHNVKPEDRDFDGDDFSESEDSGFRDDDYDRGKRGSGRQSGRSTDRKRGRKRRAPEPKKKATAPRSAKKQKG